jgi:osmotically-inducible protein OsmY
MKKDKENKTSSDQQSVQMVRQAIKDDQGLSAVARDIHVSAKEGTIILDGKVSTDQQMNLATNTAAAVAVDDKVKNRMEIGS